MENQHNDYQIIAEDKLQIGNHDSILLFGCTVQQQLRDFSKAMGSHLLNNNDVEYLIREIMKEIETFQNAAKRKPIILQRNDNKKRELLIKEYNTVLVYIDKMELALKLQEVQIIKDSKLFENLKKILEKTLIDLEKIISYGNTVMAERPDTCDSEEICNWYERLSKKIEDLKISSTVAKQCHVQVKFLLENNRKLIDRIVEAVSGTIPTWRNQITILLGIEKINRDLMIRNKVSEITQHTVAKDGVDRKNKEIRLEKLLETNELLKKVMSELQTVEKRDVDIRLELGSSLK